MKKEKETESIDYDHDVFTDAVTPILCDCCSD